MNRLRRKAGPHQSALRTASPEGEALISIIPHLAHFFHCQPGKSVVLWIYYYKKEVPHKNITKEFCFYLTLHLSEKMKQSATGLIEGIDRKTVLNQRAFLPPIIEQERIVKFLSEIEKALITQEGVLKSLVSIKKGLMQQLFI